MRVWANLAHPNIVKLHDTFVSDEEGSPYSYITQAFVPNAATLEHL